MGVINNILPHYYWPSNKLQLQIDKAGEKVLFYDNYQVNLTARG